MSLLRFSLILCGFAFGASPEGELVAKIAEQMKANATVIELAKRARALESPSPEAAKAVASAADASMSLNFDARTRLNGARSLLAAADRSGALDRLFSMEKEIIEELRSHDQVAESTRVELMKQSGGEALWQQSLKARNLIRSQMQNSLELTRKSIADQVAYMDDPDARSLFTRYQSLLLQWSALQAQYNEKDGLRDQLQYFDSQFIRRTVPTARSHN